jgi:hypothetical protein
LRAIGSSPTGQRALLLAITYQGTPWARTPHTLRQPGDDVDGVEKYLLGLLACYASAVDLNSRWLPLTESAGWLKSEITVLSDASGTPEELLPTHANIVCVPSSHARPTADSGTDERDPAAGEEQLPKCFLLMFVVTMPLASTTYPSSNVDTGHGGQRPQLDQPISPQPISRNVPGRRIVEDFDQCPYSPSTHGLRVYSWSRSHC